jgi:hypothetical protein
MKMLHFFCHRFAIFVTAASMFAQANEPAPVSGKDFKSIPIIPAKETKPWSINFAPYGWATAVDGTISLRGITSHVHESAIDTLKSVEGAFMAVAEIRYERWGILGDFIYAKTSSPSSTPRGILFSSTTADLEEFIGTFALEYRPLEAKWGFLDVLAGARVYAITSSLHLQGRLVPDLDITRHLSWVDPIIGMKGRIGISHWFFINAYGDVGGFGAGSEFTFQALLGSGFQISRWFAVITGYRALGYNFWQNETNLNLISHGPYAGVEITF